MTVMKQGFTYRAAFLLALCLLSAAARGQEKKASAYKCGDRLCVRFVLDPEDAGLTANDRLTLTPVVTRGNRIEELAPVIMTGRIRKEVDERRESLYGIREVPEDAYRNVTVRKNVGLLPDPFILYEQSVPYEPWMAGGKLVLRRELTSCGGRRVRLASLVAADIPVSLRPRISFAIPVARHAKKRSERMTAAVHFPQGRSVLLYDFADNREQLRRVDSLTSRLWGNDSLTVEKVRLKGYASPEDTYAFNTRLAGNRVRSIRKYLHEKFAMDDAAVITEIVPEDWDSLRNWVAASSLPVRDAILQAIDGTSDPDGRDAAIWSIDDGRTYRMLLREVYPRLRRVDYVIGYEVPEYSLEESGRIVRTRPEWLSCAEMCGLAASHPEGSPERAYLCALAVQYFPDDPYACCNMASVALGNGDKQTARRYLDRCKGNKIALNNLGVLYIMEGDAGEALRCFTEAAENGSEEAAYNLANFDSLGYDN